MDRDMGRSESTISQDKPAIKFFNYFLTHILGLPTLDEMDVSDLSDDLENIITGYSIYLHDTNIPINHTKYLTDPNAVPTSYLVYSSLNEYLSKAILLLKKLIKDNEFWQDQEELTDISAVKFRKACKRSQQMKDDQFG